MSVESQSYKLGGILAVAIGVLYLLAGVTFLLSPTEGVQDYKVVLPSFADSPATTFLYGLEAALIGLFALGFVPQLHLHGPVRQALRGYLARRIRAKIVVMHGHGHDNGSARDRVVDARVIDVDSRDVDDAG